MKETSSNKSMLSFSLETVYPPHSFSPPYRWGKTVYPHILFPHLTDGEKQCTPHSFPPPYRWGKTMYPPTLFPHLTDGEKQCTPPLFFPTLQMGKNSVPPHSFSPPYRWGKTMYPPTLFPHLTDGEKQCTPHSFSPPYRWRERVNYTLFPLQYGGNLKMYPTLFFPIVIRWGNRVYPLHSFSPS